jgi:hypothetical protein
VGFFSKARIATFYETEGVFVLKIIIKFNNLSLGSIVYGKKSFCFTIFVTA